MVKKNGESMMFEPVMVEIVDSEEMHGFLIPLDELKFLPRVGDTIVMPGEESARKGALYEVIDVHHTFGISDDKRGTLISISVGLKKLQ